MTNKVYNVKIIKCYLIYEDPRVQVHIVDFSSRDCQNQFRGVRPGYHKLHVNLYFILQLIKNLQKWDRSTVNHQFRNKTCT